MTVDKPAGRSPSSRLMSLDVFRGATIALMILVNDPGDPETVYWPLAHARWNGWTPTDLVFPFFLFIVGVSMAFSFTSRLQRGETKSELLKHILWRGVALFAIGVILNGAGHGFTLSTWRIYGVLQRIAICYVITAILALWSDRKGWIAAAIACLAGYWILMRFVPVPGFGVPTHDMPILDPDRNLAAWLDRKLLAGHLYEGTRDPEGVLSTIPAISTCLLGLLAGDWLRTDRSPAAKARGMALAGAMGVVAGKIFDLWFPINKKLWTSSYVLFTAGLALLCLALCYWVLDIKQWRGWSKPFLVFGMNAIAAYVLAEALAIGLEAIVLSDGTNLQEVIYQNAFEPLAAGKVASLLFALTFVLICWGPMWVLYRRRIFLKI
jgi:predicted acyltransferase